MKIELFSDMVCPFCYIGKRRLDAALARFEHRAEVEVVHRAFQLDPAAPSFARETLPEREARVHGLSAETIRARLQVVTRLAASLGLSYDLDRALPVSTFDAHRLMHHASHRHRVDEVAENLLRAYAVEGRSIADHEELASLAERAGLDRVGVLDMLASDAYAEDVRGDLARGRALGITGVPSVVIDEAYGIAGIDSADTLLRLLERARTQGPI